MESRVSESKFYRLKGMWCDGDVYICRGDIQLPLVLSPTTTVESRQKSLLFKGKNS